MASGGVQGRCWNTDLGQEGCRGRRVVRDVVEVGTWAQPVAFIAVCATLVVLYLRFCPAENQRGQVEGRGRA